MQQSPNQHDAIELKGSALPVMVLLLKKSEPELLYPQLEDLVESGGNLLAGAPVVIDPGALDEAARGLLDFSYLARFLRGAGLMPVGVQGALETELAGIAQAGLLSVTIPKKGAGREAKEAPKEPPRPEPQPERRPEPEPRHRPEPEPRETRRRPEPAPPAAVGAPAVVVTRPVRAGQQIAAPDGDLIVLASVNAGSELYAAGNIHVYGALRGRALAGVNGDTSARIFTLSGNPELLAIAGEYLVNEELPRQVLGQGFCVSFSESGLRFQILDSY